MLIIFCTNEYMPLIILTITDYSINSFVNINIIRNLYNLAT